MAKSVINDVIVLPPGITVLMRLILCRTWPDSAAP
jgi:hypothetical protein